MLKQISPLEIKDNVFGLIGREWMLISAGNLKSYNFMTAAWGGFGILWSKEVCFCYVRPTRHTYEFMEKNSSFTLSFFDEEYRDALNYCGSHSGRVVDKALKTGLTPLDLKTDTRSVYFKEAKLVIECRKIYYQDIEPDNFIDPDIHENYHKKDYHRMYAGEVIKVLST